MHSLARSAAVAAFLFSGAAIADTISVSFVEGDGPNGSDPRTEQYLLDFDVAGYGSYAAANWNNVYTAIPQPLDLNQASDGADSGADLTFAVAWPWGDWMADVTYPDGILARGNFDDGETSPGIGADILVSNIPYAGYTVVLYLSSDMHDGDGVAYADAYYGEYLVNGIGKSGGTTDGFDYLGGWILDHNCLVYEGLSGAECSILAPSRDGSIRGSIAGFQVVEAAPSCPPDLNGDGVVNSQDFIMFLNAFVAGDPLADWNDDGAINSQDFVAFLNDFVQGC